MFCGQKQQPAAAGFLLLGLGLVFFFALYKFVFYQSYGCFLGFFGGFFGKTSQFSYYSLP